MKWHARKIVVWAALPLAVLATGTTAGEVDSHSFLPVYKASSCMYEVDFMIGGDIDDEVNFFFRPVDIALDSHGNIYVTSVTADSQEPEYTLTAISRMQLAPFLETPVDSSRIHAMYVLNSGANTMAVATPFHPELMWGVLPSGNVVVCNSDDYVIKIYSSDLTLLREHRVERDRRKVTGEDKKEYFEEFKDEYEKLAKKRARFPMYRPHFVALHIDHEGYMLFQLESGADERMATYDVFTPDGRFVNTVTLPRLKRSAILSNGMIYNIELFEEESWVVYRYRRS